MIEPGQNCRMFECDAAVSCHGNEHTKTGHVLPPYEGGRET